MSKPGPGRSLSRGARALALMMGVVTALPSGAGTLDLFGFETDYKVTLGYAMAVRVESQDPALTTGPVDQMRIVFDPDPVSGGIGTFTNTGLPIQTNFDDGNRDFRKGALINNRISAFGQMQIKLDRLGLGDVGLIGSGAYHYDRAFSGTNDHDNPDSVNRQGINANGDRFGPVNKFQREAQAIGRRRLRALESYAYGEWYITETIGLSLRAGRHLAAWGESLFFPGIVSAQGPFDATKAFVPGAEVKEILLPVNQVSMQLGLTPDLTLLAYNQFEYKPTEIFPQGDYFSPADLVGDGAVFGYGSINPVHPDRCDEPTVLTPSGDEAPPDSLCSAAGGFENQPEYIYTTRTPDQLPSDDGQWGLGLKYQLASNFNLGGYYLRYHNHNPHVLLNMGYARVGDVSGSCASPEGCQAVTTQDFNVRVPVTYTLAYADDVEMQALSFSTVLWVFNIGGEVIRRVNVDTSLEATIAGVVAPWATRGTTSQAQLSFLYVNNPNFLMYDEVVVVGEMGYLQVDDVDSVANQDGVCMSGTRDCSNFSQRGDVLFYDQRASALQMLVLPKGRNVFAGWDIGTPMSLSWLVDGTPSSPGAFGALYGEGDLRASLGVSAQFLQNLEFTLTYNAFFGDPEKNIGRSDLRANPYADKDYASFAIKYNL